MTDKFTQTIFAGLLLVLSACNSEIILPIADPEQKLALLGTFSPNSPMYVEVSLVQSVLDSLPADQPLDARVSLFADNNLVGICPPQYDSVSTRWYWICDVLPQSDVRYRVEVEAPGRPMVQAADQLPPVDDNPEFWVDTAHIKVESSQWQVPVHIRIPSSANYVSHPWFMFNFDAQIGVFEQVDSSWKLTELHAWPILINSTASQSGFLNRSINNYILIQSNFWKTTNPQTIDLTITFPFTSPAVRPHSLIGKWRTLSETGYKYYTSVNRQINYDNPISSPDALYNNVVGGWGNFSGFREFRDTIIIQ